MKPRLLDLYCGAGGSSMGYARAGFEVVGVDVKAQPRYPFEFVKADALEVLTAPGWDARAFDAIHASPPCQAYSVTGYLHRRLHVDLVSRTRDLLEATGLPYVIENVVGAPLRDPVQLCGSSFGLDIERHRLFETNWPILVPPCAHGWQTPRFPPNRSGRKGKLARVLTVAGTGGGLKDSADGGGKASVDEWRRVMEIDWMTRAELAQAIPPVYTELIGSQLLEVVSRVPA